MIRPYMGAVGHVYKVMRMEHTSEKGGSLVPENTESDEGDAGKL